MQSSFRAYDFSESIERITEILSDADASYSEHQGIPSRDLLTFNNGYYVDVTILFVDIRGSKELAEKHTRPVLAKIYRAYISEVVAVLKSDMCISEIYIEGDGVWAVFNTNTKDDVSRVFETSARVVSLVDILNIKFRQKGYSQISVGIGLEDGVALYVKAGFKGSGINEVVWIGKSVGAAAQLCSNGSKKLFDGKVMVSERVWSMLPSGYKNLLSWHVEYGCYHGDIWNIAMNEWVKRNG